jgi:hypothetical protein
LKCSGLAIAGKHRGEMGPMNGRHERCSSH